jgi:hypothetical protein
VTRDQTEAELRRLAAGVREVDEGEAVARLLERVTAGSEPERLRAALAEVGARTLLSDTRAVSSVAEDLERAPW